jgi:hypothetical protein
VVGEDPTRAKNKSLDSAAQKLLFSRALGTPIDALRVDWVVGFIGLPHRLSAIEDVVGGVVHHGKTMGDRDLTNQPDGFCIDSVGEVGLSLGSVYGCISGGINNLCGTECLDMGRKCIPQVDEIIERGLRATKT